MKITGGPFRAGTSPAVLERLPLVAAHLKGRWSADEYSIGDAVQACCPGHAVAVMEAIRARTYPLSVNAWEHLPNRTEESVLGMLEAPSD
ncbi:MAG TPA: hypothetical protein VK934_10230 [Fimbriimonas sp.]|nr:hypothetical protein [Fimbriimonas sp.]